MASRFAAPVNSRPAVNNEDEYFDILVIGRTGYGKSTTADKLVIANPAGLDYRVGHQDPRLSPDETAIVIGDLSMWIAQRDPTDPEGSHTQAHEHLKNLGMFRQLNDPHKEVVESRQLDVAKDSTKQCELVSNETSKVRVLDTPGFNSLHLLESQPSTFANLAEANSGIMQKLVRIQAIAGLKFSRILYFLPTRGPMERIDASFVQELQLMKHFFGKAIFRSMIVVATLHQRRSSRGAFFDEDFEDTRKGLNEAMRSVFKEDEGIPESPPIIYLSVKDTCEQVLETVKSTHVVNDKLRLELDRDVCIRCSMKIGYFHGRKVICAFGNDLTQGIPYIESLCHPLLKPKWSRAWRIVGHIGNAFAGKKKYAWVSDVVCVACSADVGTHGCMRVKEKFSFRKKEYTVDHTNQLHHIAINMDDHMEGEDVF